MIISGLIFSGTGCTIVLALALFPPFFLFLRPVQTETCQKRDPIRGRFLAIRVLQVETYLSGKTRDDVDCFYYFKRSSLVPLIKGPPETSGLCSSKFSVLRLHLLLCFFGKKKLCID